MVLGAGTSPVRLLHPSGGENSHGNVQNVLANSTADNLKPESIDAWARFHRSVEELPVDQCEVFHLVWYGGMEQKKIADLLGISVSTVKRRFRSARVCLFDALDGESPLSEEQK